MLKFITFTYILILYINLSAQTIPEGLRNVEYNGAYYNILGLTISPDEKNLAISSYGGRFYLLNIENRISKSALSQGEKVVWKKNIAGFKNGVKPIFSKDGKYLLMKHVYEKEISSKYKPTACVVLESATGKIVFERTDGIMSADFANENTLIIATEQNLEWIDLQTNNTIKSLEMPQAEAIAVNKSGTILAISYIPTKAEFANLKSIDNRKKEIKNAKKNKRLLEFLSLPDLQTISVVEDELDVVFRMKFADDDKSLLFLSRALTKNHGMGRNDKRQETNINTAKAMHIMKINVESGIIDRDFYYRSMYANADFCTNSSNEWFGISSSNAAGGSVGGRSLGAKNGVEIYDYHIQEKLLATINTKFKFFKKNASPYQFAFLNDSKQLYISINQNLYLWNTEVLNNYTFNSLNADEEDVIETATNQLDSLSLVNEDFKKQSVGIKLTGIYSFDITLVKKGQVLTVFSVTDEATDIRGYNFMLNFIKNMKFENIKIEKERRIKFKYDFNFEE